MHLERTVTFCLLPPSPIKICCTIAVFLFDDRPAKHLPSSVQMSTSQQYKIANKKSVLTTVLFAYLRWTGPYWANICPRCTSRGGLCCFLLNLRSGADMWSARTRVLGPTGSTSASRKSTRNAMCVPSLLHLSVSPQALAKFLVPGGGNRVPGMSCRDCPCVCKKVVEEALKLRAMAFAVDALSVDTVNSSSAVILWGWSG